VPGAPFLDRLVTLVLIEDVTKVDLADRGDTCLDELDDRDRPADVVRHSEALARLRQRRDACLVVGQQPGRSGLAALQDCRDQLSRSVLPWLAELEWGRFHCAVHPGNAIRAPTLTPRRRRSSPSPEAANVAPYRRHEPIPDRFGYWTQPASSVVVA